MKSVLLALVLVALVGVGVVAGASRLALVPRHVSAPCTPVLLKASFMRVGERDSTPHKVGDDVTYYPWGIVKSVNYYPSREEVEVITVTLSKDALLRYTSVFPWAVKDYAVMISINKRRWAGYVTISPQGTIISKPPYPVNASVSGDDIVINVPINGYDPYTYWSTQHHYELDVDVLPAVEFRKGVPVNWLALPGYHAVLGCPGCVIKHLIVPENPIVVATLRNYASTPVTYTYKYMLPRTVIVPPQTSTVVTFTRVGYTVATTVPCPNGKCYCKLPLTSSHQQASPAVPPPSATSSVLVTPVTHIFTHVTVTQARHASGTSTSLWDQIRSVVQSLVERIREWLASFRWPW